MMKTKNLHPISSIKKYTNFILLYSAILWISSNFIITGDDYYFANKSFSSFSDVQALESNGRYLGNLLEVVLVKLSLNNTNIIRNTFMGTGIFLIILLVLKSSNLKIKLALIYSATLLLAAPSGMYKEIYSWTPGFINYLLPTLSLLTILLIFKHERKINISQNNIFYCIIVFLLGFFSQFFMEHMTIYSVILSFFIVIIYYITYKKFTSLGLSYFFSSTIGAAIMLSSPSYTNVLSSNDAYRSTGFSSMNDLMIKFISNLVEASRDIVIRNCVLTIFLCILCIILLRHTKNINIKKLNILKMINQLICLLTILYVCTNRLIIENIESLSKNKFIYLIHISIAFLFLFMLLSTIIAFISDKHYKYKMLFYIISILVASAPLLFVSPIGSRCFYVSYVFLTILSLDLLSYLIEHLNINIPYLQQITIISLFITCISVGYIYWSTNQVYSIRVSYISQEMSNNKNEIKIPNLPYPKYIQNDTSEFLGAYYYYNERHDIKFNFIDLNEWKRECILN